MNIYQKNKEQKIMSMKKLILISVGFCVSCGMLNAGKAREKEKWDGFMQNIERIHEIEQSLGDRGKPEEEIAREAEKALEELADMHFEVGDAFLTLYKGRLAALAGKPKEALIYWKKAIKNKTTAPEALESTFLMRRGRQKQIDLTHLFDDGASYFDNVVDPSKDHLANFLPLSSWGREKDDRIMGEQGVINTDMMGSRKSSLFSVFDGRNAHNYVARSFFLMNMPEWAELASVENVYYTMNPVNLARADISGRRKWLSPIAAPYWVKAAEYAWIQGKTDDAAVYAAKAYVFGDEDSQETVVFGDEDSQKTVRKLVSEWRAQAPPEEMPPPQFNARFSEKRRERLATTNRPTEPFKMVLYYYRRNRLYPRVLQLLDEYGEEALGRERSEELREEMRKEFLELAEWQTVIWGQDASTPEARLEIETPPPAREKARREAAEWLAGIIELLEQKEGEGTEAEKNKNN